MTQLPLGPVWWGCVRGYACAPVRMSVLLCILADALYLVLVLCGFLIWISSLVKGLFKSRVHVHSGRLLSGLLVCGCSLQRLPKGLLAGACVGSSLFSCGTVTFNEQNVLLSRCQNLQAWPLWSVFWLCRRLFYLEAAEVFCLSSRACSCGLWVLWGGHCRFCTALLGGNAAHLHTGSACGGPMSASGCVSTVLQLFKNCDVNFLN